jgi:glycine hydroxymethyltransferase
MKLLCYVKGLTLTVEIQSTCTSTTVKDFKAKMEEDETVKAKIASLRAEVEAFALSFPMPGHDDV